MGGSYSVVMGDRGRLVVPAELRERYDLHAGSKLVLLDRPDGILLVTRDQLKKMVRADLAGFDMVAELIAERRAAAAAEDMVE